MNKEISHNVPINAKTSSEAKYKRKMNVVTFEGRQVSDREMRFKLTVVE